MPNTFARRLQRLLRRFLRPARVADGNASIICDPEMLQARSGSAADEDDADFLPLAKAL